MSEGAIDGESGAYVPCLELASPFPADPVGAITGSDVGYVPAEMEASPFPDDPTGAITGSGVGFVPRPCCPIDLFGNRVVISPEVHPNEWQDFGVADGAYPTPPLPETESDIQLAEDAGPFVNEVRCQGGIMRMYVRGGSLGGFTTAFGGQYRINDPAAILPFFAAADDATISVKFRVSRIAPPGFFLDVYMEIAGFNTGANRFDDTNEIVRARMENTTGFVQVQSAGNTSVAKHDWQAGVWYTMELRKVTSANELYGRVWVSGQTPPPFLGPVFYFLGTRYEQAIGLKFRTNSIADDIAVEWAELINVC